MPIPCPELIKKSSKEAISGQVCGIGLPHSTACTMAVPSALMQSELGLTSGAQAEPWHVSC